MHDGKNTKLTDHFLLTAQLFRGRHQNVVIVRLQRDMHLQRQQLLHHRPGLHR